MSLKSLAHRARRVHQRNEARPLPHGGAARGIQSGGARDGHGRRDGLEPQHPAATRRGAVSRHRGADAFGHSRGRGQLGRTLE